MRFRYTQWDGQEFPTQDHLLEFSAFLDYLIEYGQEALDALQHLEQDPEHAKLLDKLIEEGLLEKVGARFRLTPRAVTSLQRKALMEVFRNLEPGSAGSHDTPRPGAGGERDLGSRPYRFGDPVSEIDLTTTLKNALQRRGISVPIRVGEEDFELYRSDARTTCSTVILLDMSGSMGRWGRFVQAKRCAMAVYALIKQRFLLDTVDVVGFYSAASVIPEHQLPLVTPRRVTMFDPQIRLRIPVSDPDAGPQHFTNLHMGLLSARRLLARRGGHNKQVFIITDGEPTAHVQGEYLYLLYPPEESTLMATLSEAMTLTRQGIRFATFALVDDYYCMDWLGFVEKLTKLTKGVAFYCTAGTLASCIVESYLSGKKRKSYLT